MNCYWEGCCGGAAARTVGGAGVSVERVLAVVRGLSVVLWLAGRRALRRGRALRWPQGAGRVR